ncbi:sulfite exporter TauE/SafE family protein [Rhodohalobacter sp. SW132]|uniref:sulfite exporter TauE/SafE family protein n=1 Tax=Rhodohalobacter sp. SW132 TaxID=2293433 RepID=UPI000E258978|nr:sulfite exporter TauE/SafE family protein [Rhodohalobacter sp. SW132]REL37602.1 sulfite exporter TauE/SafE family protein [Rhodohalobacter sp. SW132]
MILLLIVIGIFTGILAGVFGIGGGTLFTPVLFILFTSLGVEQPVAWTIGTSLFCTFTAASSSSIQQLKQKNMFGREGIKVGLFGAAGVFIGKQISTSAIYTEQIFVTFFACLLILVAWMFYRRGKSEKIVTERTSAIGTKKTAVTGLGGGFVAALAGVGGGVVVVPVLNLIYKINISKAVSVSSLAVLVISLSGWLQFALLSGQVAGATGFTLGFVDFGTGFPLIIGAFIGGFFGVKLGEKMTQDRRQVAFSVLAIIIALIMIYTIL